MMLGADFQVDSLKVAERDEAAVRREDPADIVGSGIVVAMSSMVSHLHLLYRRLARRECFPA